MTVMRFLLVMIVAMIGLATPAMAQAIPGGTGPHIATSLVPESLTPAAGSRTTIAISMNPQPGWHGYWQTPGDSGFPLKADWTLPKGVKASDPAYPVPTTLVIAGLMNHVYEKPYALLVPIDIPAGLTKGTTLPISAKLNYLVCTTSICVPESAKVSASLTVGDGTPDPSSTAKFAVWREAMPRPLGSPAQFKITGGKFRLAVPLPASVGLDHPHLFAVTDGAAAYAAPQSFSRDGNTLVIETAAGPAPGKTFDGVLSLGHGIGLSLSAIPGVVPSSGTSIATISSSTPVRHGTPVLTLVAFAGALLGGLILNVMPCVFPILSLKALSLAKGGGAEQDVRRESLAYSMGVILVCVALGGLILAARAAGAEVGWAFQLQDPGIVFVLVLLVTAIAFNLAGLFELGAVSAGSGLASKHGIAGSFWTGALAAFVATPCTGPFMAGALGVALVLPAAAALLVFAGLGLGLALPFLAIGFIPAFRRVLPKPGAWMETFRHILAIPMFLTALGLAWVLGQQTQAGGVIVTLGAAMLLAIGLWFTGQRQRRFAGWAWVPAGIAALCAVGCYTFLPSATQTLAHSQVADSTTLGKTVPFDATKLGALRAAKRPVFLYFTADWCLSCKVNEKIAIERDETQAAFSKAGVTTMVGDWTDGDAAIGKFLDAHSRSGVPLYLWYAPGKGARTLPQILTPGMLVALAASPGK